MSRTGISLPTALAGAALVISIATAGAVGLERISDWTVIQGEGRRTASPQSPFEIDLAARILFPSLRAPDGPHHNHMVSLGYNWHWDKEAGWSRPDPASPSVALTLESWFSGLAELNLDMRPPRQFTDWPGGRLMGFAARHDGTYATLSLGGTMFNPAGAGIKLTAGTSGAPLMVLSEGAEPSSILQVVREDKLLSLSIEGGVSPSLSFGLSGTRADQLDRGVLRFSGALEDAPLINVIGSGPQSILLASAPGNDRDRLAFRIGADGRLEWDVNGNEPSAALSVHGKELVVEGGLATPLLRIGAAGAGIHQIRAISIELEPEIVGGHGTSEQAFPVMGLSRDAILILNGPAQPYGIGIAWVQAMDDGLAIGFVNASAAPIRPSAGRYFVLAISAAE